MPVRTAKHRCAPPANTLLATSVLGGTSLVLVLRNRRPRAGGGDGRESKEIHSEVPHCRVDGRSQPVATHRATRVSLSHVRRIPELDRAMATGVVDFVVVRQATRERPATRRRRLRAGVVKAHSERAFPMPALGRAIEFGDAMAYIWRTSGTVGIPRPKTQQRPALPLAWRLARTRGLLDHFTRIHVDRRSAAGRSAWRLRLKLGFISFGGPAGQIAVMHEELVERRRWISELSICMRSTTAWCCPDPGGAAACHLHGLCSTARSVASLPGRCSWSLCFISDRAVVRLSLSFGDVPAVAGVLYGISGGNGDRRVAR